MIQLSSSISSLSFKSNTKHNEFISLPEVTSITHTQENHLNNINHIDMNSQEMDTVII